MISIRIKQMLRNEYWPQEKFIRKEYNNVLKKCLYFINHDNIEGDYLEFGVYKGDSIKIAYEYAKQFSLSKMNFWGFDSFEGFPDEKTEPVCKHFAQGKLASNIEVTKRKFSRRSLRNQVHLIKGFYQESLTDDIQKEIRKAAIINIDCDLYSSAREALNFVTPLVQPGTLIIVDDWFCNHASPQRGEQKAFLEWTEQNKHLSFSEFERYGVHGKVFVCHS